MNRPAVTLVADWERPDVADVREAVEATLSARAPIIERVPADDDASEPCPESTCSVVVGGDGTIMRHLRRVAGTDHPVLGVNVGRLGFLAEFDVERLEACADDLLAGRLPIQQQHLAAWEGPALDGGSTPSRGLAVNDCAIVSGQPFRMIELELEIDGDTGPRFSGDGLVIATPTGSTAYSASAGGPIVHPGVAAMLITPVAAHSLAFRPIVVGGRARIDVRVVRANFGTSLVRDGEVVAPLRTGDRVSVHGGASSSQLVVDPAASYWDILQDKLNWARPPRYRR